MKVRSVPFAMRVVRSDFAFSRRSSLLAAKKTLAPAPTASEAIASPIPEEAPVMRMTFPVKGSVVEEAMIKTESTTVASELTTQFQNFPCGNFPVCLRTTNDVAILEGFFLPKELGRHPLYSDSPWSCVDLQFFKQ